MFGNKSKVEKSSSAMSNSQSPAKKSLNSVSEGTKLEGTLNAESDIRIDGELLGNLNCKAKLIVGPKGRIEGDIKCKNAVIEGSIVGTLKVTEILNVRETANVQGEVITNQLVVQAGAKFNVSCNMGGQIIKDLSNNSNKKTIAASIGA